MLVPPPTVLNQYERFRAIEVALNEGPIGDMVTNAALDFAAESIGIPERGEHLYEHDDFTVISELATYHYRVSGKTVIEEFFEQAKPAVGTDEFRLLTAMMNSRVTLLRLRESVRGVGVHVDDLLFGGHLFLADVVLSKKEKTLAGVVVVTRVFEFDDFAMTPCTSYLDFDPELAEVVVSGLKKESGVAMAQRYASADAKTELATDLMEMALCNPESLREELDERFSAEDEDP